MIQDAFLLVLQFYLFNLFHYYMLVSLLFLLLLILIGIIEKTKLIQVHITWIIIILKYKKLSFINLFRVGKTKKP